MTAITAHSRQKRSRRKSVALFRLNTPHTARNAAGWQARRRKSAVFIEKLHIAYHDVCCISVYGIKIKRGISAAANVLLFASAYYCLMV